jgi:hypothetical protein
MKKQTKDDIMKARLAAAIEAVSCQYAVDRHISYINAECRVIMELKRTIIPQMEGVVGKRRWFGWR